MFPGFLLRVFMFLLCLLGVAALPTQNITIEVPDGTTNYDDPSLLCTPTKWSDIVAFFYFFTHAATVVIYPGEPIFDVIINIAAVFLPASGAMQGLNSIMRHSILGTKDPLQQAAQSGAFCMVVRSTSWKPKTGDAVTDAWVVETSSEPLLRRAMLSVC